MTEEAPFLDFTLVTMFPSSCFLGYTIEHATPGQFDRNFLASYEATMKTPMFDVVRTVTKQAVKQTKQESLASEFECYLIKCLPETDEEWEFAQVDSAISKVTTKPPEEVTVKDCLLQGKYDCILLLEVPKNLRRSSLYCKNKDHAKKHDGSLARGIQKEFSDYVRMMMKKISNEKAFHSIILKTFTQKTSKFLQQELTIETLEEIFVRIGETVDSINQYIETIPCSEELGQLCLRLGHEILGFLCRELKVSKQKYLNLLMLSHVEEMTKPGSFWRDFPSRLDELREAITEFKKAA